MELTVAATVPEPLLGVGLFDPGRRHCGIGRISDGLGCPHLETDPDFLGIMLAFRSGGRRVDFLGINDPAAPTDTVEEFIALLAATAEAAGAEHQPATRFGAARQLAYRRSQAGRTALPEAIYESAFETGEITPELADEVLRRYRANRAAGHAGPDLGTLE